MRFPRETRKERTKRLRKELRKERYILWFYIIGLIIAILLGSLGILISD